MAAIKGKSPVGGAVSGAANQAAVLAGRVAIGGLCGVGAVWTISALWPLGRRYVRLFASQLENLSHDYPTVLLGLVLGIGATLVWQALRK